MKTYTISILIIFLINACFAQPIPTDSLYLAQTPPTNSAPKRFFLPVSSGSFTAERIAITNDGKEIYYSVVHSYYPTAGDTIKYFKYSDNKWTGPFNLFNSYIAPGLSITGDTMYFQNNSVSYQTLISVRTGTGWSNPQRILYGINSAHYFQETNNENYYVSSVSNPSIGGSDWCKLFINGADTTAISLGLPLNSGTEDLDLFVSKDESFMIVVKYAGYVTSLYISYHKNNGNWTNPKSLGPTINFGLGEWGPYVSSDDKYLFYTAGTNPNYSDTYIYWSRIDGLIDSLKHTNFIPYLKNKIPNQTDTVGHLFNFTVPDSTFIDDDGNNTLTYSATLSNGSSLPSWLNFNPATRTFSGTPTAVGSLGLKVIATDTANASASCTFNFNIFDRTFIHESNGQIIIEYKLFQNYPNPFNPSTVIGYSLLNNSYVSIKLYDILGKQITTLVNSFQKRGMYDVILDMNKLNLSSGLYFYTLTVTESNSDKVFKEAKVMNYLK
ncbi:MAG: putative Ig domain-containing protein [Ignavibacteriae bacterium]|nr:putative Ig domain-containing protein [Ignavibacteriota bacterium]